MASELKKGESREGANRPDFAAMTAGLGALITDLTGRSQREARAEDACRLVLEAAELRNYASRARRMLDSYRFLCRDAFLAPIVARGAALPYDELREVMSEWWASLDTQLVRSHGDPDALAPHASFLLTLSAYEAPTREIIERMGYAKRSNKPALGLSMSPGEQALSIRVSHVLAEEGGGLDDKL